MRRWFILLLTVLGGLLVSVLALTPPGALNYNLSQGERKMSEFTGAGQVQVRPDGSKIFTHGHSFPDNVQRVTQEYNAAGQLIRAQVKWTGFAGKVLDVTATFDSAGQLLQETGYRAPQMTTPVTELLKPLPAGVSSSAPTEQKQSSDAAGPVVVPSLVPAAPTPPAAAPKPIGEAAPESLSDGLHQIYRDKSIK